MRNGVNSVNEISAVTFAKLRASCQTMWLPGDAGLMCGDDAGADSVWGAGCWGGEEVIGNWRGRASVVADAKMTHVPEFC